IGWSVPMVGNTSVAATGLISTKPPSGVLGTTKVKNLVMEVFQSTKHHADATRVNQAVKTMTKLGNIPSTLINALNYDSMPLIHAAAEEVGSADDAEKLADALEDQDVLDNAKTAMFKRYHFTSDDQSPQVSADDFEFIAPSS